MKQLALLVIVAAVAVVVKAQTAEDDEVNAAYPGYPHTFYSGTSLLNQDIF